MLYNQSESKSSLLWPGSFRIVPEIQSAVDVVLVRFRLPETRVHAHFGNFLNLRFLKSEAQWRRRHEKCVFAQ